MSNLLQVYTERGDMPGAEAAAERLRALAPNDPIVMLAQARAQIAAGRMVRPLRVLREFVARFPNHDEADSAQAMPGALEAATEQLLASAGLAGEDGIEVAALHERSLGMLDRGDYRQARALAQQALQRAPRFVPALNNISLAYATEGNLEAAMRTTERALDLDPANVHALSNRIRTLCLAGRDAEAQQYATRLRATVPASGDGWVKQAEAFSFLGDDAAVLEAYQQAQRVNLTREASTPANRALGLHLTAVAVWHQENTRHARLLWRLTLKAMPGHELTQANLDDHDQPVGERNLNIEIYDTPEHNHGPEAEALMIEASEALATRGAESAARAETLLEQAYGIDPDAPDIQNNLAAAYELQGRGEEAEALVAQIHARHPDYFFATARLAQRAAHRGDVEMARTLMEPLLARRRMHLSEFRALVMAELETLFAAQQYDGIRSWLDLWEQVDPDNENIHYWTFRLALGDRRNRRTRRARS